MSLEAHPSVGGLGFSDVSSGSSSSASGTSASSVHDVNKTDKAEIAAPSAVADDPKAGEGAEDDSLLDCADDADGKSLVDESDQRAVCMRVSLIDHEVLS